MPSLQVKYETDDTELLQQGYKLRVTAHTPVDMSAHVFVMKAIPGQTGRTNDEFSHVAGPVDLEESPEQSPEGDSPYYRVATIELYFRTPVELAEVKANIDLDVSELVTALNTVYETEEDVSYG